MSAVKDAASLSPWCLARLAEKPARRHYRLADGEPGPAALGWLLAQHRFDALSLEERRAGARAARAGHRRSRRGSRRPCGWPKRPRWSATWSTRPPPISGPAELEQAVRDEAKRSGAQVARHRGRASSPTGYPLIAAVGARRDRRARAAADRARMGQARAIRASRSSARACASTAAGSTSSRPAACG